MKKSNLYYSMAFLLIGISLLFLSIGIESKLGSLLFGLAIAFTANAIIGVYQYLHWSKPENKDEYECKLEEAERSRKDERLISIRDKAGRYSYLFGLATLTISLWTFILLEHFNVIGSNKILSIFLGFYLIIQIVIGFVFFNYLNSKY